MNNNFFRRLTDSLKEFGKRDAAICVAAAIVIIVLIVNVYINRTKDDIAFRETPVSASPTADVSTELELRLENILSKISGTGKVDVMITYEAESADADSEPISSKPLGAVVIAQGADNLEVRIKIQQAVQTVLGIEARQVKIFEMGNN